MGFNNFINKQIYIKFSKFSEYSVYVLSLLALLIGLFPTSIYVGYYIQGIYLSSIGAILCTFLIHHLLGSGKRKEETFVFLDSIIEICLISLLIYFSGGGLSIFIPLLIFPVIGAIVNRNILQNVVVFLLTQAVLFIILVLQGQRGDYSMETYTLVTMLVLTVVYIRMMIARDILRDFEISSMKNVSKINELMQVNKYKDEFVYFATHELRSPITIVKGYIDLFKEDQSNSLSQRSNETLTSISEHIDNLSIIIQELLDISKVETGKISIRPVEFNIVELLAYISEDLLIDAKNRGINIDFERPSNNNIMIVSDRERLKEILLNLIENGIKYSKRDGVVRIECIDQEDKIQINIKDNGIGIPVEDQSKIFQKFFRAKNVYSASKEGSGLGLYIVYKLVDILGGSVSFISKENEGTSFKIILPKKNEVRNINK